MKLIFSFFLLAAVSFGVNAEMLQIKDIRIDGLERVNGSGVGEVDLLTVVMLEPRNTPRAFWRAVGVIAKVGFAVPSARSTSGVACDVGVKSKILWIGAGGVVCSPMSFARVDRVVARSLQEFG